MSKKLKLYKMIDKTDSNTTEKDIIDNVPFRMIICGRSGLGKTSLIGGLLLLPNFFKNDFLGSRIFLFSPMKNDYKMSVIAGKDGKDIPADNIFTEYDVPAEFFMVLDISKKLKNIENKTVCYAHEFREII